MPHFFNASSNHNASRNSNRVAIRKLTGLTSDMFKPLTGEDMPFVDVFVSALNTFSETVELAVGLAFFPFVILTESINDSGLFFEAMCFRAVNIVLNAINFVASLLSLITRPLSSLATETTPASDSLSTDIDDSLVLHA